MKKPFHKSIKSLIWGGNKSDEQKAQKIGLPLKSRYRIATALYLIRITKIPSKEIPKIIKLVEKIIEETEEKEISSYAQEILKDLKTRK